MPPSPKQTPPLRSESHLDWIRRQGCAVPGCWEYYTECHPHHVRLGTKAGMKMKPGDDRCIPLCAVHHDEIHRGQNKFASKYGLHIEMEVKRYAEASPALRGSEMP